MLNSRLRSILLASISGIYRWFVIIIILYTLVPYLSDFISRNGETSFDILNLTVQIYFKIVIAVN